MESTAVEVMDLTVQEKTELAELETVIENGMKHFLVVGRALLRIRDSRLYRDTHRTFNDYCRDRWGMSRSYAHRMIEGAKTADNLLPIGNTPVNEAQARPLTRLEPERQDAAWQEAVETAPEGVRQGCKMAQKKGTRCRMPSNDFKRLRVTGVARSCHPPTMVPTDLPLMTALMLPFLEMLNTRMGISFSRQREMAAASITLRFFANASV